MIVFKIKEGIDGYNMTADFRGEYLKTRDEDNMDINALHIAGYEKEKIICVGRMYIKDEKTCIIDNVAVDEENRRQYVADTILRAFEDRAVQLMRAFIEVKPTPESREFFVHEGYVGEDVMKKDLTKVRGCRGCKK